MAEKAVAADAGYAPEKLDPVIAAGLDRLEKAVADVERIRGTAEPQLDLVRQRLAAAIEKGELTDAGVIQNAERLIEWLEKYARTTLNLAKMVDELSRLRSFLAGGADSRPDVKGLSDADIAKVVRSAAAGLPPGTSVADIAKSGGSK